MLTRFIESRISAEERRLGESLDYLRYILRASGPAFFKYIKIMPMANFRRSLPPDAYHAAALLATSHEGCGDCVQIAVNLARLAGVSAETIQAVLERRPEHLNIVIRDVYLFTLAVLQDNPSQEDYRPRIVERFGDAGLVELGMKISASRVFPQMTRALGFASSCSEHSVQS